MKRLVNQVRRGWLVAGVAGGAHLALGGRARAQTAAAPPLVGPVGAIVHARIHPGDGRRIDNGTIVIDGGRLVTVGGPDTKVPAGRVVLDAQGDWVTPGLVDAESLTGLVEVHLEASTREVGLDDKTDPIRAAFQVLDGWNIRSPVIPVTLNEGVTACALAPQYGLVSGRGAVVRLGAADAESATLRSPSAVYVDLTQGGRKAVTGAHGGLLLKLRELLDDVRQYAKRRQEFERNGMRKLAASRLDLEALIPVVQGTLPLVAEVTRASDIEAVLRLARDEQVKVILSGCEEGWRVAAAIAAAKVPVIVNVLQNLPRDFEALASRLDNAALLNAAGVAVSLSPREREDFESRTLRFQAGNAVANGLPWEDGLAGITRRPAVLFGVEDRIGTLAAGKIADLVLWSGDPFEPLTRPRHVVVGGQVIARVSRQTLLRDRFRSLHGARR